MTKTGILIDPRFRDHRPGRTHPERPERIEVLESMVSDWTGPSLERVDTRLADVEELARIHSADHIARIEATQGIEHDRIDADTATSEDSYEVALLAAGGLIDLVDRVAARDIDNGFAFVRPPGHHATDQRAMGFCLFNNAAVAARHLRERRGCERVAIIDWDLHHGNGTEAIFYDDPGVLYVSLHQYPFYPGTGAATDLGRGAGEGHTVNVPFSAGVGDDGYLLAFDELICPILRAYAPDFILVSAGFDAHRRDPLGELAATEAGFVEMTRRLRHVAAETCQGRIAAVLEGGYDLEAIRSSSTAVLGELVSPLAPVAATGLDGAPLEALKAIHRPFWSV